MNILESLQILGINRQIIASLDIYADQTILLVGLQNKYLTQ